MNYQVKKKSFAGVKSGGVKESKKPLTGEFIAIEYEVPSNDYFQTPKKKDGTYKLPYQRFINNKKLKRLPNGFVVFTPYIFKNKKMELDHALK